MIKTKAYKRTIKLQTRGIKHFTYLSEMEQYGVGERFDRGGEKLLSDKDFIGDCDRFSGELVDYAIKSNTVKAKDLIEMVTPNHYICGVIDRELNDVWVMENTGFEWTKKALDNPDFPVFANNMPTKDKYANGFIEPKVYRLSELQKGIIIPEVRGSFYMIPARVKKYVMEQFRTADEPLGQKWWTRRDDLPFLKDFIENRDIAGIVPAENLNSKYSFTKQWEVAFVLDVNIFKVSVNYNSERAQGDRLHLNGSVAGLKVLNGKRQDEEDIIVYPNLFKFGRRSRRELEGVHPDLVTMCNETIKRTNYDFGVFDGIRTETEQWKLVQRGVSKTLDSYHVYGLAVDLVPYLNGKYTWEGAEAELAFDEIHRVCTNIIEEFDLLDIDNGFDKWGWDRPHWQKTGHKMDYDIRQGGYLV